MMDNLAWHEGNFTQFMEKQLAWDQLLLEIQCIFSTIYQKDLPRSLELSLNEMAKRALSSNVPSNKLYDFSIEKQKQKLIGITTAKVPDGIFPKNYTSELYDIKVKGEGPDDFLYNIHSDLRNYIPRGTTLMSMAGINNEQDLDVVLYANRKFTNTIGDDANQAEQWRSYCLDNPDEAGEVVAMEKLDGDAAPFSGRFINGKFYIFTGSKNVHMLISSEEDIEKYDGIRYNTAKVIARTVWKHLVQMQEKNRQILFSLLHHTKCTVVCEVLLPNNQHIVNLSSVKIHHCMY
ncbi:unnamed protein product [Meganyctiphanes norvegica]|uniref:DUF7920 domain-containing protein n=1 Tax=Meganyctiphanes norvegica TaxID=48144 RepID=A0AAV2R6V4_MEGNR